MKPNIQVNLIYKSSGTTAIGTKYYGGIVGKATRIHDIATKGWFVPEEADCKVGEYTYLSDPLELSNTNYPNLVIGNKVVPGSEKIYMKQLHYVSMLQSGTALGLADRIIAVPIAVNQVKLIKNTAGKTNQLKPNLISAEHLDTQLTLAPAEVYLGEANTELYIPGTFLATITVTTASGSFPIYISDKPNIAGKLSVENILVAERYPLSEAVVGNFYVYADPTKVSVSQNNFKYYFDNGFKFLSTGTISLATYETIVSITKSAVISTGNFLTRAETCNLAIGDTIALSARSGSEGNGPAVTINADSTLTMESFNSEDIYTMQAIKPKFLNPVFSGIDNTETNVFTSISDLSYAEAIISFTDTYELADGNMDFRPHFSFSVSTVETEHARRLSASEYELVTTGSEDTLSNFSIDFNLIMINTRVRDYSDSLSVIAAYDDNPENYASITPLITSDNFIKGSLYIEYLENVVGESMTNAAGRFLLTDILEEDPSESELVRRIGQYDPRNELGFSLGLVRKLTTVTDIYVYPCDAIANGLTALSRDASVLLVWHVSSETSPSFANWVETQNSSSISKFRIGFSSEGIPESYTRLDDPDLNFTLAVSDSGRTTVTVVDTTNFITLGVKAGDSILLDSGLKKIAYVASRTLVLENRYILQDHYSSFTATGTGVFTATVASDLNLASLLVKVKTKNTSDNSTMIWEGDLSYFAQSDVPVEVTLTSRTVTVAVKSGQAIRIINSYYTAYPSDKNYVGLNVIKEMSINEQVNYKVNNMVTKNPKMVITLSKGITIKNSINGDIETLPEFAYSALIFSSKITMYANASLINVTYSTDDQSLVSAPGMSDFEDYLNILHDAGFCIITSLPGGKPYCVDDVTAAYSLHGDTTRGCLSKAHPELMYAKDIITLVKVCQGNYNTNAEGYIPAINTKLMALKDKYLTAVTSNLGPLLKEAETPVVSVAGTDTIITYKINTPDPNKYYINNIIVGN